MQQPELVLLKTYGSRSEVEVAKSALASASIDAVIEADTAGRMREHLAWSGIGFRLFVRADDAEAARDFLAAPAESSASTGDER